MSQVDPDQPIYDMFTLERVESNQLLGLSYVAVMLTILGVLALVLAAVGVYGVMSHATAERTHEIGIRLALGAQRADVLGMALRSGMILAVIGALIGLPASIALARLMASLLYGVSSSDLLSFAGGTVLLLGISAIACYLPARRAMRVDPMVALRYE